MPLTSFISFRKNDLEWKILFIICVFKMWLYHLKSSKCFSIGIKHDFLCINICWDPREVLKPRAWGPADVNVSEKHVWSLLLHENIFFAGKLRKNCFKKFFLPIPIMARKSTLPANVLKTPLPGQRLTSSLLCSLLMMTSVFIMAPECLFVKPQSRALTACELPC